ncbi:MAG: FAD-binding protein [Hyphomicrobiales bacterium]|nr:FAD-binding protein [Hyphomicrobiales bacterium]
MTAQRLMPAFANRLNKAIEGEVLTDNFSRGRYATDASAYQMMPHTVVIPRRTEDVAAAIDIAREEGLAITPRGGGTSQCGQTVNNAIVIDTSKHLNRILSFDKNEKRCVVEPGIVLDDLNRQLKGHKLWFPVDISTSSRATIGGMTGNNSCGGRSLRYGTTRDNVVAVDAIIPNGTKLHFGKVPRDAAGENAGGPDKDLFRDMLRLGEREAAEIAARFPSVQRRVGGYNLDALVPNGPANNMAHLLIGSEGTLAFTTAVELKLSPVLGPKVMGVCHFGSFYEAMDAAQHLVKLEPIAVELIDRTMIELGRDIPIYRPTLEAIVRGEPDAVLVVEFAESPKENKKRLAALADLMADLGFSWDREPRKWGGVVDVIEPKLQAALTEVRKGGLNIMMSMKQEGKPVSFVEDCAVPLEHLAEYTDGLTRIFEKHGTRGTWYAHASVGCLHVRPVLNLKQDKDVKAMRAIAEEAFDLVKSYKGSHSGEHGDGIVRSEFHEKMFGPEIIRAFETVKDTFDPHGLFNPGKIVRPPKMNDRRLLRYGPEYDVKNLKTALDWSAWPGKGGGFQGAVEMCNNNGACRKLAGGVMCPSYRVTRDEKDVVRGRANTLRLAISGQLGEDALTSDAMADTLKLCVSCKGCKRECPTSVDMAKMKIEVLSARAEKFGLSPRDRMVGYLPRYAPYASKLPRLMNMRNWFPGLRQLTEWFLGISAKRALPAWVFDTFDPETPAFGPEDGREVVFFADTFNTYFEPENARAAITVLAAAGYRVLFPQADDGINRPLCCGRTFLSAGLVEEARKEARRTLQTLLPLARRGVPVIGLEPSCLLTLRDEFKAMLPGEDTDTLSENAFLFEEFLAREKENGKLELPLAPIAGKAYLHGHCHQKAFDAVRPVEEVLKLIPEMEVETIQTSCCGMAGAFGYQAETYDVSIKMAELSLLPAVRKAEKDALIVADGTSCRHQIADGTGRKPQHVARVLETSLKAAKMSESVAAAEREGHGHEHA